MGNNASHSGNISQRHEIDQEQQWAHSFPRTPQKLNQHKVLPDVTIDIHQKLRPTNNGEILYSGGTISGRHQPPHLSSMPDSLQNGMYRSSTLSNKGSHEYIAENINHTLHNFGATGDGFPSRKNQIYTVELLHSHNPEQDAQRELHMKRFGSVPDLRGAPDDVEYIKREIRENASKSRKKYKAPPPPPPPTTGTGNVLISNGSSLDSWDVSNGETADSPVRRTRLFKTRAETKTKSQSPQTHRRSLENSSQNKNEMKRFKSKIKESSKKLEPQTNIEVPLKKEINHKVDLKHRIPLSEMQRSKSLPEFQAELREATQKLRSMKYGKQVKETKSINKLENNIKAKHKVDEKKEQKLKTLDHNVYKKEHVKYKMKQINKNNDKVKNEENNNIKLKKPDNSKNIEISRGRACGKESSPESSPGKQRKNLESKGQPSKTFYFGMDDVGETKFIDSKIVDNFAQSLPKQNYMLPTQAYSESDLSSELDIDESQTSSNGIALHLRPILPKKQLEIPRFSPAAAWRLLSTFDTNPPPSTVSDEGPVLVEDKIEKFARQPPLLSIAAAGPRSSHDKSGDSGISGDAGPPGFEDTPDPILLNPRNNISGANYPVNISWTPQQDLEGEEESSSEGGVHGTRTGYKRTTSTKFSARAQVFSLSLPRDNHLAAYMEEKARLNSSPNYTNLQRLKRSVSGVLGNFSNKTKENQMNQTHEQNDNWFLSRSAPNSLNNGFNFLEMRLSQNNNSNISQENTDDRESPLVPPVSTKHLPTSNCGRLMYLPQCTDNQNFHPYCKDSDNDSQYKQQNTKDRYKYGEDALDSGFDSNKNCHKISMTNSCENVPSSTLINKKHTEPEDMQDSVPTEEDKWKGHKRKRFTFQSTVRQIERKRLAEKLSREAERKEQQRLSELEVMRRVEEEFQRKRAKEKASIRQQLRLFSMEDSTWSNPATNMDIKEDVPTRSEPDGAVSSSTSSPILDDANKMTDTIPITSVETLFVNSKIGQPKKFKKILSRQSSESSDDARMKVHATQVLSEYRQPRREYKEYRARCLPEPTDTPHTDTKQTTVHPKVIYNMPKATHSHQGSSNEGASRSNNYRRDFAHGIILPVKGNENIPEQSKTNVKKQVARITQNQRTRLGKFIS